MKTLNLTSFILFITFALGSLSVQAADEPPNADELSPTASQCLHNYKKRRDRFAIGTAVTPVVGAGSVYGGAFAGGYFGAAALANQGGGWGGLIGAVLGIEIGAFTVAATTVGLEIGFAVELAKAEKMFQIVKAAEAGSGGAIDRGYKKFIKRHKELAQKVSKEQYTKQIFDWDQSNALCDGSLKPKKPKPNETRLRKLLLTPKELDHALFKEFSTQ